MPMRRAFLALLAVTAALGLGAPAAGASTLPAWTAPAWTGGTPATAGGFPGADAGFQAVAPCGHATNGVGQSDVGGTQSQACLGSGLVFVGPAIGQVASVIGPTIIGPAVVGTSIASAGNAAVGVP
jgi:hypothetical protein